MHKLDIPQWLRDRVIPRRGRWEIFQEIDAPATALLVVDMQKAFVAEGAPLEVPVARSIVPNINAIAAALRAAGGHIIWVKTTLTDASGASAWTVYHQNFFTPDKASYHRNAVSADAPWHDLYGELDVQAEDRVFEKKRFSAFFSNAPKLDDVLREKAIDTLIVTGTLTNLCCESTARDGMMSGYKILFPHDANATLTDEEHNGSLVNIAQGFGDVRASAEIVAMLQAAR